MDSETDKVLKASFVSAANHLTQLYTNSMHAQKQSFTQGYNKATREVMEWLVKNCNNKSVINVEELMDHLKIKLEASTNQYNMALANKRPEEFQTQFVNRAPPPQQQQQAFEIFNTGFPFTFGSNNQHSIPQQQPTMSQSSNTTSNPFGFSSNMENNASPVFQNHVQQANPFAAVPQPGNTDQKKRVLEHPQTSMEYSYPEQINKRTKLIT